jgi:hypothetical protein
MNISKKLVNENKRHAPLQMHDIVKRSARLKHPGKQQITVKNICTTGGVVRESSD